MNAKGSLIFLGASTDVRAFFLVFDDIVELAMISKVVDSQKFIRIDEEGATDVVSRLVEMLVSSVHFLRRDRISALSQC